MCRPLVERAAGAALIYEGVALTVGGLPPITRLVRRCRTNDGACLAVCVAVGALSGWLGWHFVIEAERP